MSDVITPAERNSLIEAALSSEDGRLALAASMANPNIYWEAIG